MSIALVTGCNKGIGFYIARGLCEKGYAVIMGCRDAAKAKEAESRIKTDFPGAVLHHVTVDLSKPSTVAAAAIEVKSTFGPAIDILVNNAGFAYKTDSTVPFHTQAEVSAAINYRATRAMCESFAPLIKKGGRIVNVSSTAGTLSIIHGDALKKRWLAADSGDDIDFLVGEFLAHTKTSDFEQLGWPASAYGVSKLANTTFTRVFGKAHPEIHIFACCPGWCRTDMSSQEGLKSAQEGADTPLWLATSSECLNVIPQGGFAADRKAI
ncbi:putative short chain dehydrogenase [Leptomonas pyrrhocoris]|uniref:Putative short chain dehydrogenase n=1 Tax=Leptomonas pyrrhocoris TaxID=157538 RepID=A0A0N0DVQ1_LEPPY|nr:putative short chain dehydrogenase [Leptomonas pyrrhocoris]KPA80431.1 putative short chain dehydrogenase [Leptomonas pyrrhocoris]|eukprot:XP_015658870.1 putative short chain dehydrogenase [Leptomonas pyrrhocoris]